jgi:hypothetical protein
MRIYCNAIAELSLLICHIDLTVDHGHRIWRYLGKTGLDQPPTVNMLDLVELGGCLEQDGILLFFFGGKDIQKTAVQQFFLRY